MKPAPQPDLQPLNTNVSIVDQTYMALKGAIMDADILAIERKFVSRNVS